MTVQTRKMTAAEFLALPETNLPHELIYGEEIMSPAPELKHQDIVLQVAILLKQRLQQGKVYLAPVDVYLDDENVVQPDVCYVTPNSNCHPLNGKYLQGAPDLMIEVVSPGSAKRDRLDKFHLYEKYGVREYWIIDPAEQLLEIWQLQENRFVRVDIFGVENACQSPLVGEVDVKVIFVQ